MCANLEAGQHYSIYSGNKELNEPDYDIAYFKEDIPANLPTIKTNNLQILEEVKALPPVEKERELSFFETPVFMWSVIIVVYLFLLFICFKMISDMKKKK